MASIIETIKKFLPKSPTQDVLANRATISALEAADPTTQARDNNASNFVDYLKDGIDDAAALWAATLWGLMWKDVNEVYERAQSKPLTEQLWDDVWEPVSNVTGNILGTWQELLSYITKAYNNNPISIVNPFGSAVSAIPKQIASDIWNSNLGKSIRMWVNGFINSTDEEAELDYIKGTGGLWNTLEKTINEMPASNSPFADMYSWEAMTTWLYSGDISPNALSSTIWKEADKVTSGVANAIKETKKSIDWAGAYKEYEDDTSQFPQALAPLWLYTTDNIERAISDLESKWYDNATATVAVLGERDEAFQSILWKHIKWDISLMDWDFKKIADSISSYNSYEDDLLKRFNEAEDKKYETLYKKYYPNSWEKRLEARRQEKESATLYNEAGTKSLPLASQELARINLTATQKDRVVNNKNFWTVVNYISNNQRETANTIKELEWYAEGVPNGKEFVNQIKEKLSITDENQRYYAEKLLLWSFTTPDNIQNSANVDREYIRDKILPTLNGNIEVPWIFDWTTKYSKEDLENIVNGVGVNSENTAAKIVAYDIMKPLLNVTGLDWENINIKLEQFWNIGMQGINYVKKQIKDILISRSDMAYKRLGYQTIWQVNYAVWGAFQTIENMLAWYSRWLQRWIQDSQEWEYWNLVMWWLLTAAQWWLQNKTVQSLLGESNELNFEVKWWNLNEWLNGLTNFVDEYWEVLPDIAFLIANPTSVISKVTWLTKLSNAYRRAAVLVEAADWLRSLNYAEKADDLIASASKLEKMMMKSRSNSFIQWIENTLSNVKWYTKSAWLSSDYSTLENIVNKWWDAKEISEAVFKFNSSVQKANSRSQAFNKMFYELVDNAIQDRIIWDFIVGKTSFWYTDRDVSTDLAISLWVIPLFRWVTWIIRWFEWLGAWYRRWEEFSKMLSNIGEYKNSKNALLDAFDFAWLKNWVDYKLLDGWEIVPMSQEAGEKMLWAQQFWWASLAKVSELFRVNPEQADIALAQAVLQADLLNMARKWWLTTETLSMASILNAEADALLKWWAPASVYSKYFKFLWDKLNIMKTPSSLAVIWWETMRIESKAEDALNFVWLTEEEAKVWITKTSLDNKITETGNPDIAQLFSKEEITKADWTKEELYFFWWNTDIQRWLKNAEWDMLDELMSRLPDEQKNRVEWRKNLFKDLDTDLKC